VRKKETELLISCVCFIFLAIGAYTAWNSPATGYEASIYAATALIFWIAVAICITTGVVIIVMRSREMAVIVSSLLLSLYC